MKTLWKIWEDLPIKGTFLFARTILGKFKGIWSVYVKKSRLFCAFPARLVVTYAEELLDLADITIVTFRKDDMWM